MDTELLLIGVVVVTLLAVWLWRRQRRTVTLRAGAAFRSDEFIGATILIPDPQTGVSQQRTITAYDPATNTATVDEWAAVPSDAVTYRIIPKRRSES